MAIRHLLDNANEHLQSYGIITYIDFVAAFDSILHSYLLNALKEYEVPLKYCRLIKAIYASATVRVRLQEVRGTRSYSRKIPIRRGALQGDLPSPECFLVALGKLLKDHGRTGPGLQITENVHLDDLEFAVDAAMTDENAEQSTIRLTNLDENGKRESEMEISIPKIKSQHIQNRPKVTNTTEADVANLPPNLALKFKCEQCSQTYANKHGLAVHQGRWCKGRRKKKKQSRKGTVADRIVQRHKVEEHQKTLPKVKIGEQVLENVFVFEYLGAAIAADGDQTITLKHRCDVAWGRFGQYIKMLMSTKLPLDLRIRLYASVVVSTMIYGSSAWLFTKDIKRKLNGVNSRMLSLITKRTIHEEAKDPTLDIIESVLKRRWSFLGHILRMDEDRAVHRILLKLSPEAAPYVPGSLLDDTSYETVHEMKVVAADREQWKAAWKSK